MRKSKAKAIAIAKQKDNYFAFLTAMLALAVMLSFFVA